MRSAGQMAHRPVNSLVPVLEVTQDLGFPLTCGPSLTEGSSLRDLCQGSLQDKTVQWKVSLLAWFVGGKVGAVPLPVHLSFSHLSILSTSGGGKRCSQGKVARICCSTSETQQEQAQWVMLRIHREAWASIAGQDSWADGLVLL